MQGPLGRAPNPSTKSEVLLPLKVWAYWADDDITWKIPRAMADGHPSGHSGAAGSDAPAPKAKSKGKAKPTKKK
eukprot:9386855-Alexandrium_andersonii.AAC.1